MERVGVGIDAEIEIVRESHIAVRCQGDRLYPLRREYAADLFSSLDDALGIGHGSRLAGGRSKFGEALGHPQGSLDPLLDRHPTDPVDLRLPRGSVAGAWPQSWKRTLFIHDPILTERHKWRK